MLIYSTLEVDMWACMYRRILFYYSHLLQNFLFYHGSTCRHVGLVRMYRRILLILFYYDSYSFDLSKVFLQVGYCTQVDLYHTRRVCSYKPGLSFEILSLEHDSLSCSQGCSYSTKLALATLHLWLSQCCMFLKSERLESVRYVAAKSA